MYIDMLQSLKTMLGITTNEKDGLIQFVLDTVEDQVKVYCNITEVPDELKRIIVRMAADTYRAEGGYGDETVNQNQNVSSVTRGDVTTKFEQSSSSSSTAGSGNGGAVGVNDSNAFFSNYTAQLNAYRRLRW